MKTNTVLAAIALAALPAMALAQGTHGGHSGHSSSAPASASAASKAYMAANDKMHGPMVQAAKESDPDVAFVKGMIPHHQGAIEMARVVLRYGKDEQTKKWATDVIREQQREIDEMLAWLKMNGK